MSNAKKIFLWTCFFIKIAISFLLIISSSINLLDFITLSNSTFAENREMAKNLEVGNYLFMLLFSGIFILSAVMDIREIKHNIYKKRWYINTFVLIVFLILIYILKAAIPICILLFVGMYVFLIVITSKYKIYFQKNG